MLKMQIIILICLIFLDYVKSEVKGPKDCEVNEYFVCEPWNCGGTCKCVPDVEIKYVPPPSCPANSELKFCSKKYEERCSGKSDDPNEQCKSGCSCQPGYCRCEEVGRCMKEINEFKVPDHQWTIVTRWG